MAESCVTLSMMIPEKSLVIYKNRPALVSGFEGEKITISVPGAGALKVREKDIEVIFPGPCALKDLEETAPPGNVREAWELLANDAAAEISLKELAELVYGSFLASTAWAAYELLREGIYFTGDVRALKARPRAAVEGDEKKREEKQRETGDRAAFLEKMKKLPPFKGISGQAFQGGAALPELSETDRRFLQDVEALALGKTDKSKTLKELGKGETPEEAHRLLLASGAWTVWENPHPSRFGLDRESAKISPSPPPPEERLDLSALAAYAIDNPWSDDPDDAVSLEGPDTEGRHCLWVHVADPAASILPGSPADLEARGRGTTLYLPEGASRMLAPATLPIFALGLSDVSPALSFKITLKRDLTVGEIDIIPSLVKVTRLSYAEADALITGGTAEGSTLAALAALAERNVERRLNTGAVIIELPDVHIQVDLKGLREKDLSPGESGNSSLGNRISVEPIDSYRSADMIRECMIWAGEGTARWALQRQLPIPFVSQEAGELPEKRLSGLAGAWQLRRCMRPRILSVKPGVHWGLGLDEYTQVTSPLRRYTDLLCHQQIRAWLNTNEGRGEASRGQGPLSEEEVLFRLGAAEAAAAAAVKTERASRAHWMAVYLSGNNAGGNTDIWEAVILDRRGNRGTVIIPALGIETQLNLRGKEELNDRIQLSLSSVKIPEGELSFVQA